MKKIMTAGALLCAAAAMTAVAQVPAYTPAPGAAATSGATVLPMDTMIQVTPVQEGKGNTVAALLGSMFVSGRSAIMTSGQLVTAFTAEAIPSA